MDARLFSDNAFQRILVEPAMRGNNELFVVSGYASPAMVVRHFEALSKVPNRVSIDLQVGMASKDGVPRESLTGYRSLGRQVSDGEVTCRFNTGAPIHSKLYVWCGENGPTQAFAGSGNYTQTGFGIGTSANRQKEVFVEIEPKTAFDYIVEVSGSTILASDPDFESLLEITDASSYFAEVEAGNSDRSSGQDRGLDVVLPLVQTTKEKGKVHNSGAGLNWGQRGRRDPNEAYIPIPSWIRRREFFPERGVHFQIVTDDGDSFVATVAQGGDKAIETPEDNALIGLYFRRKLGVLPGAFVTNEHLQRFGSNGARFTRLSEDLYRLSFEPGTDYFSEAEGE